ncbi:MAG: nucleotidyltransferase domain-containing protein [Holophagales bacterium]|nr:nucleotidyltransferase domain-containing protein [Holophagales bacterium]
MYYLDVNLRTAKTLTAREYHARRERERREALEAHRHEMLERARRAIRRHLPEHPAIRGVYLFGSILKPGRFHSRSDVDVAVEADTIEAESPFARALEQDLGVFVDLRPLDGAVAEAVAEEGEEVKP